MSFGDEIRSALATLPIPAPRNQFWREVHDQLVRALDQTATPSSHAAVELIGLTGRDRHPIRVLLASASILAIVVAGLVWLNGRDTVTPAGPPEVPSSVDPTGGTSPESTSVPGTSGPSTVAAVPAATVPDASTGDTTVPDSTTSSAHRCPAPPDYISVLRGNQADVAAYDAMSLQSDLQAISVFAQATPDYAGREITADMPARIKVWMRGDLAVHTTDLQAVVEHHDRLEVVAPKYSTDQINAIVNQIVTDAQAHPDDFADFSYGPSEPQQVVAFGLAPGEENLAQAYVERWGDAVRISVGNMSFVPPGCGIQPLSRKCPDLNGVEGASADLTLALTETTPTIEQRGRGISTLTVTNQGTKPFTMDVGAPISGVLVIPGTVHVVGVVGGTKGTGLGINVASGGSTSINVVFAAFRCDGETGSAAPPGSYGLRVVLSSEEQGDTRAYLSPEIPVTVTSNSN